MLKAFLVSLTASTHLMRTRRPGAVPAAEGAGPEGGGLPPSVPGDRAKTIQASAEQSASVAKQRMVSRQLCPVSGTSTLLAVATALIVPAGERSS